MFSLHKMGVAFVAATVLLTGVWSSSYAGDSHHGGPRHKTLKIADEGDFASIDPAVCFDIGCVPVLEAVCAQPLRIDADGLVVPEIAVALPTLSNGDKTYTFELRDDFRFSPPSNEKVDAETIKQSLVRSLHASFDNAYYFYPDIEGVDDYRSGAASDISGISASGQTLSITLAQPSGDFLQRIGLGFACALPKGTPIEEFTTPIPMAGPYRITKWVENPIAEEEGESDHIKLVLKRNPNHPSHSKHGQHSGDDRPFFDKVVYKLGLPDGEPLALVEGGKSDYISDVPLEERDRVLAEYPDRAQLNAVPAVEFMALNTLRWPLCNEHMRRALNFAFDRAGFVFEVFGSTGGTATEQYVPPGVPGNLGAPGQYYPAPGDLAAAQADRDLFDADMASPASSCEPPEAWMPGDVVDVEFLTPTSSIYEIVSDGYMRPGFEAIGVNLVQTAVAWPERGELRDAGMFDIYNTGWFADYLDPGNFLNTFFEHGSPYNYGWFDEAMNERLLDAKLLVDPTERVDTYTEIHEDLVEAGAGLAWANQQIMILTSERLDCVHPVKGVVIRDVCLKRDSGHGSGCSRPRP